MSARRNGWRCAFAALVLGPLVVHAASARGETLLPSGAARGQELFEREWRVGDPASPRGDGLGPLFNDVSCVGCHKQGGAGGGGPNDKNVDLLSVVVSPRLAADPPLTTRLARVHAGLVVEGKSIGSVVLHRGGAFERYEPWRLWRLGAKAAHDDDPAKIAQHRREFDERRGKATPVMRLPKRHGVNLRLSQRNTPSLFGAGLIDRIETDVLRAAAGRQRATGAGVRGRVPIAGGGGTGRFGWRGQIATLEEFVRTACSNELGLQTQESEQPADPRHPDQKMLGVDLTEAELEDLLEYVATLPPPAEVPPANYAERVVLADGRRLFETAGCAACHLRILGDVEGLYSDLLLHDMGTDLADPVAATPEPASVTPPVFRPTFSYSGASVPRLVDTDRPEERRWRTPPLWGVRDSAPYLHDGRAATMEQAILLHGGEAQPSATRYRKLPRAERDRLLLFVTSLGAPSGE